MLLKQKINFQIPKKRIVRDSKLVEDSKVVEGLGVSKYAQKKPLTFVDVINMKESYSTKKKPLWRFLTNLNIIQE